MKKLTKKVPFKIRSNLLKYDQILYLLTSKDLWILLSGELNQLYRLPNTKKHIKEIV